MQDLISRQAAIDALCAVCGKACDKSEFVYNAPQDEQVILCPEHYCLCTLPSAQPSAADTNVATTDTISRRAAIEAIEKYDFFFPEYMERFVTELRDAMKKDLLNEVKSLPPVDRPTGHWIEDEKQNVLMRKFIEKGEVWRVCSVCGAGLMIGAEYETDKYYHETFHNYCPNCGCAMKGGEEE